MTTQEDLDRIKSEARYHRYHNFCKNYKLEDNIKEELFNIELMNYETRYAFLRDYTSRLLYAIIERYENGSNIFLGIYGEQNSGKSEGAQFLAKFMKSYVYLIKGLRSKIWYAFSSADFNIITDNLEPGDVGLRDESSKPSGKGSVNVQKHLDNLMRIIRLDQNSFIFVDIIAIKLDIITYHLKAMGKNYKKRETRFLLYDDKMNLLGRVYLPLHWCKKFRDRYEELKKRNLAKGKKFSGLYGVPINKKKLNQDINLLTKHCMDQDIHLKNEIDTEIPFIDEIQGDDYYIKVLVNKTYQKIKKILKKRVNIKIIYSEVYDFTEFVISNLSNRTERRMAITLGVLRGDSISEILRNNPYLTRSKITETSLPKLDKEYAALAEWYIGIKYFKIPPKQIAKYCAGYDSRTKPDINYKEKIGSVKFSRINEREHIKFLQSKDMKPERMTVGPTGVFEFFYVNPVINIEARTILDAKSGDEVVIKNPKHKKS